MKCLSFRKIIQCFSILILFDEVVYKNYIIHLLKSPVFLFYMLARLVNVCHHRKYIHCLNINNNILINIFNNKYPINFMIR